MSPLVMAAIERYLQKKALSKLMEKEEDEYIYVYE